jgi:hypothetical protein
VVVGAVLTGLYKVIVAANISDQRSHLSLKKMAARVKQQNIIYSSLAESMLDGEIKIDDNYWSLTNNIISIIAITTTFVNAILIQT